MFQFSAALPVRVIRRAWVSVVVVLGMASVACAAEAPSLFTMEGLDAFFNTKWGQYSLITVFFALIIGYLRVLFGPRGWFREKKWDQWNEEFRRKEAEEKAAWEAAILAEQEAKRQAKEQAKHQKQANG